jgi:hypothetical protein
MITQFIAEHSINLISLFIHFQHDVLRLYLICGKYYFSLGQHFSIKRVFIIIAANPNATNSILRISNPSTPFRRIANLAGRPEDGRKINPYPPSSRKQIRQDKSLYIINTTNLEDIKKFRIFTKNFQDVVLNLFIPCMVAVLTAVLFLRFCCYPASFASVAVVYGTCRIYPRFLVETGYHLKNTAGSYTAKTRCKPVARNGILLMAP